MRLILTILCGTRAGQRVVVARGETLRAGRTHKADLVISDDPTMSALHFELECGETTVFARDLQSRNRLFLNGEAVTEAVLANGDQLRAGRTFFSVSIVDPLAPYGVPALADETRAAGPLDATFADRRAPVPKAVPGGEAMPAAAFFPGRLAGHSDDDEPTPRDFESDPRGRVGPGDDTARVYAIVESEIGSAIAGNTLRDQRRAARLAFIGPAPDESQGVPLLVEMDGDRLNDSWDGQPPRILIESTADFDDLYSHLRGVFCSTDDESGRALFGFFEPNTLYQWLKRCGPLELTNLFARLSSIDLDITSTGRFLRFAHVDGELIEQRL